MSWLALKIASWLIHALVVMVSVAAVSRGNREEHAAPRAPRHLPRGAARHPVRLVLVPAGARDHRARRLVHRLYVAYDIGFGQAFAAGLVQVALGLFVDYMLPPHLW